MTIISDDRYSPFSFDHDRQLLAVEQGATIAVEFGPAVTDGDAGAAWNFCSVFNHGSIYSNTDAIVMNGDQAVVTNQVDGFISGYGYGVHFGGSASRIDNYGYISAAGYGVYFDTSGYVFNAGDISGGETGVFLGGGTVENTGMIRGDSSSISGGADFLTIINSGSLIGEVYLGSSIACEVRNSGEIEGLVFMTFGDDSYDGRGSEAAIVNAAGGDDTLRGGGGDDTFSGGLGSDRLRGGGGADVFTYFSVNESRNNSIDVIRGWDSLDLLDLSHIDANTHKKGVQEFGFGGLINAADPVAANKVEYYHKNGDTFVVADINGDGAADLTIRIAGSVTLAADDFVLG